MRIAWKDDPEKEHIKIDGDNPEHIKWIFEKALKRAQDCNISGVDYKLTQGVVKRIIPAIASTNAVIAAGCANEAFKIATNASKHLQNWMMYNGGWGIWTNTTMYEKTEDCLVCSLTGCMVNVEPESTLQEFINSLIADKDKFLYITNPSVVKIDEHTGDKSFLHMTGIMSKSTAGNLQKKMKDLLVTNKYQNFAIRVFLLFFGGNLKSKRFHQQTFLR